MESYKITIEIAILVFPLIAFILTIPFLIHQYQKYGAIPFFKSVIFYSMILYLITAYFMVILPLPSKAFVSTLKSNWLQLQPFNFIHDIRVTTNYHINDIKTLLTFFNKPTVYTIIFNLFLTMPFGFYLRYYYKQKWYKTIIYSFLLSLFFELTQLSGLYGYYPRPYRIFDVDDLIINTTGGLLGHIFAPLLMFFLPSKDELESKSYTKGQKVSLLRRIVAFFIDGLCISLFNIIIQLFLYNSKIENYSILLTISIYYLILPLLFKGKTIGKAIVKIKVASIENETKWYQILLRYFIFTYIFIFPIVWLNILESILTFNNKEIIFSIIKIIFILLQIINILYYIVSSIRKEHLFLYEKISKTKNVSTIVVEKNINNVNKDTKIKHNKELKEKKYNDTHKNML